jgi:hypothetical protein
MQVSVLKMLVSAIYGALKTSEGQTALAYFCAF